MRALAIMAPAAVVATAIGLWRETTAYEWRILGHGTLAQAKLFAGVPPLSDQRYEWFEGRIRSMPLAMVAADPMIVLTRERFVRIAARNVLLVFGLGAGACLVLLVINHRRRGRAPLRGDDETTGPTRIHRLERRLPKCVIERALPVLGRRAWRIGEVRFPRGAETHHIMVSCSSGSDRTAVVADLLRQARARYERCIVHDPTGTYTKLLYDPTQDVLLNPLDVRCPRWSPLFDARDSGGFEALAAALFPAPADTAGRFHAMAARQLFASAAEALRREGIAANAVLLDLLLVAPPGALARRLEGTAAEAIVNRIDPAALQSVRTMLGAVLAPLRFLPDEGAPFSIREWVRRENGTGWLFLAWPGNRYGHLKSLVSAFTDIALSALLAQDTEGEHRLWAVLDDPAALHRLPGLEPALVDARGLGVRFLIGIPAIGPLRALYGVDGAATISGLCGTRVAMMATDEETAEWSSGNLGDGPRTVSWPWEILRLPRGHGYVRFPGGLPAAKFVLDDKQPRAAGKPFVPADGAERFLDKPSAEAVPEAAAGQRADPAESCPPSKPGAGRKKSRQRSSGKGPSSQTRRPAPKTPMRNSTDKPPERGATGGANAGKGDGNAGTPPPAAVERRKRKYGRWI